MKEEIIQLEWEMFSTAMNIGGRAYCQDDWDTFRIMRESQFEFYSDTTCSYYLQDLKEAKEANINLMTIKYGYMMATTDKEEYEKIKDYLPVISEKQKQIIEAVVQIEVSWTEELYAKYPNLLKIARKIHTSEDTMDDTSSETYLRAELSTYSMPTLVSYANDIVALAKSNQNLIEKIVEKEVQAYGYASLEEANEKIK